MMKIDLCNIGKNIRGTPILQDITLSLASGHIYGFKGKNGSGKTMLMRMICGFIYPTSGTMLFNEKPLKRGDAPPFKIGALIENPAFLFEYTGYENLQFLARLQGDITDSEVREAIAQVGLSFDDKRKYKKYSLGMKQRLGIAAAIMGTPDVVILDEPMNALDEKGIAMVGHLILSLKQKGSLVLLSNHDSQNLNQFSDEVFVLVDGKIVDSYIPAKHEEKVL